MSGVSSSTAPSSDAAAAAAAASAAPGPAAAPVYYPANCFHLSPTLNTWCPLRAADVDRLTRFAEFEGQNVFFHLNHPIRFVRVAGVVVASTEYSKHPDQYTRHVYVVDDGSGATVPCFASDTKAAQAVQAVPEVQPAQPAQQPVARPDEPGVPAAGAGASAAGGSAPRASAFIPPGTVLDVKGELQRFGGAFQIHVRKATPLRSTEQEAQVWAKMHAFARDTLARPWVLDRAVARACRRAARRARARGQQLVAAPAAADKGSRARDDGDGDAAASHTSGTAPARKPRPPPRKKWQITPD